MTPFSLLVKPVGGNCNINCSYCFYRRHPAGRLDPELLDRAIAAYAALPFGGKAVALQGGEPLLAAAEIRAAVARHRVEKSVQTNATLITDELAAELARDRWLVGASLDGPRELDSARDGSFDAAVAGIRRLEAAGADYNILAVVSRANVGHPLETYRFLRDSFRTGFLQFIECTGPTLEITGAEWGRFLIAVFDEWRAHDTRRVSIRLFDSILAQLLTGSPTQCTASETCDHHLVIEHDGSVYPCDFFVEPGLRLGSIAENSWEEMLASPVRQAFARRKQETVPARCRLCRHFAFCRGDCPRNRQSLCEGWKAFYDHALPGFESLAAEVARQGY